MSARRDSTTATLSKAVAVAIKGIVRRAIRDATKNTRAAEIALQSKIDAQQQVALLLRRRIKNYETALDKADHLIASLEATPLGVETKKLRLALRRVTGERDHQKHELEQLRAHRSADDAIRKLAHHSVLLISCIVNNIPGLSIEERISIQKQLTERPLSANDLLVTAFTQNPVCSDQVTDFINSSGTSTKTRRGTPP